MCYILTLKLRHSEMGKVTINSRIDAAVAMNSMQPIGSGSAGTNHKNRRLVIGFIYDLFIVLLTFLTIYC
jgi:hypothetical protein